MYSDAERPRIKREGKMEKTSARDFCNETTQEVTMFSTRQDMANSLVTGVVSRLLNSTSRTQTTI